MARIASKMKLFAGFEAEYKKRHDEIWPELSTLLKELGITIQNKTKGEKLAEELDQSVKPGPIPTMDEIVAEIKEFRGGR